MSDHEHAGIPFHDEDGFPLWVSWAWVVCSVLITSAVRLGYRLRATGRRRIPKRGGVLIVSNHMSSVDPPVVGVVVWPRKLYYMAKVELFRPWALRFVITRTGAFPVRRGESDREAIRMARGILRRGDAMVMFPEGTRSEDGILGAPFPGAGMLALEPGITVVPMALWGTKFRFGPVRAVVGEPIDMSDLGSGPRSERARIATERMMDALADLVPLAGGPVQPDRAGDP